MIIRDILHKNKSGAAIGLPSFCSSNMFVIDAALDYVLQKDVPIVIEATCNQINQFGGYTGILPKDFSKKVRSLATEKGIGVIILVRTHGSIYLQVKQCKMLKLWLRIMSKQDLLKFIWMQVWLVKEKIR